MCLLMVHPCYSFGYSHATAVQLPVDGLVVSAIDDKLRVMVLLFLFVVTATFNLAQPQSLNTLS